jgi:hypothetical protein
MLASTAEFGELREHQADRFLHAAVGILLQTIVGLHIADRRGAWTRLVRVAWTEKPRVRCLVCTEKSLVSKVVRRRGAIAGIRAAIERCWWLLMSRYRWWAH